MKCLTAKKSAGGTKKFSGCVTEVPGKCKKSAQNGQKKIGEGVVPRSFPSGISFATGYDEKNMSHVVVSMVYDEFCTHID